MSSCWVEESAMAPSTQDLNIFEDAPRSPTKPSYIRSILAGKAHKRNHSVDEAFAPRSFHRYRPSESSFGSSVDVMDQQQCPLGEITANNREAGDGARSPTKPGKGGLHKKTKSAVSLKSLRSYMERKDKSTDYLPDDESLEWKSKKNKSATSLSAILKRSQRGRKDSSSKDSYNKENRGLFDIGDTVPSPVGNPYSAQSLQGQAASSKSPDKRRTIQDEVSLYTPKGYSPAQQRNFHDFQQPYLAKPSASKPRPKSDILSGNRVREALGLAARTSTDHPEPDQEPECTSPSKSRRSHRFSRSRANSGSEAKVQQPEEKREASPKKGSRVQAAISAFNAKEQEADLHRRLNAKDLESEFEKLLVSETLLAVIFTHTQKLTKENRMHETSLITCGTR